MTQPQPQVQQPEDEKCDWCGRPLDATTSEGTRIVHSFHTALGPQNTYTTKDGEVDCEWEPMEEWDLCDKCDEAMAGAIRMAKHACEDEGEEARRAR